MNSHADRRMKFDDVAHERCDDVYAVWKSKLFDTERLREIGRLILKHTDGLPEQLHAPKCGAYNVVLRMTFQNAKAVLIRFPIPAYAFEPEEKTLNEVAVLRFLEQHTSIPVPHVFHHGITNDSLADMGPYIIMDYVTNKDDLTSALNTPGLTDEDRPMLDPNVSYDRLEFVYGQMAEIMLQLAKAEFSSIGSIEKANKEDEFDDEWVVKHRPLTMNMNELVKVGNFPEDLLPTEAFKTASSFYLSLANLHLLHLSTQHNDAIYSAEDCRRKYIARCLFRRLAREGRLHDKSNEEGPFKLFCDDFRLANVLANEQFQITGAIDWEFTYAAPTAFVYSPPFWLLIEKPEYWPEGLADWIEKFAKRLQIFLKVMKEKEDAAIARGVLQKRHRLSNHMIRSWESGDFWISYAARKSWAFDMIYWSKIDARYFGKGDLQDRLHLLTESERDAMDAFVQRKLAEKEERTLADWADVDLQTYIVA